MKEFRASFSALLLAGALSVAFAQQTFVLSETYPRSQATNVVFVADGYTEPMFEDFRADAVVFRNAFLADPALAAYANFFNYYGIFSVSAEAGATAENITSDAQCSDPSVVKTTSNTAWGSSYCRSNIQRLLYVNSAIAVQRYVRDIIPEADIFIVIGTSMAVYPAAGLIHYVPRAAECYVVDPKEVPVSRPVTFIKEVATKGVTQLVNQLLNEA